MSNLVVSNISDGTTSVGTGYVVNGSAKAYASASGSTGVIQSFNVASFVDGGTGAQTINLTNSMAAQPVVAASAEHSGGPYRASVVKAWTTGSAIGWTTNNTSGSSVDISYSTVTGQGNIA